MNALDLQSRKVWLSGGAALAFLILLAGWFLAVHPKRSDAASLREQNTSVQLQNEQLRAQSTALTRQGRHLASYQADLAKALAALPSQTGLSAFSQSLTAYAQHSGIDLTSISVGTPTAVATPAALAPTATTTDSTDTSTASSAAPVPATSTAAAAAGPVSTTFTAQATGTTDAELAFLSAVRTGPRSALITSTQFTTGTDGGGVSLTAQITVFSSPMPSAQLHALQQLLKPAGR